MAQAQQKTKKTNQTTVAKNESSYSAVIERLNNIMASYSNLPMDSIYGAFGRAWANMAPLQNQRVKAIGSLPADYDKQSLGEFLRSPQTSEQQLRQVAEGLKWSVYSFYKLQKGYADILTYRHYAIPEYITAEELKSDTFKREYKLVNKLTKAFDVRSFGHKAVGEAIVNGKVFYVPRYRIDKSHNKVDFAFMQRLPQNWTLIEGFNNISGYTLSFNLMYFYQMGTDYRQFGDLFEPFMSDFNEWISADTQTAFKAKRKYIYASRNNAEVESNVRAWYQNGRWCYWISLPIDRTWTFEIDDSTPIVASPFSGLMQTFAQQADYEAAQLSLILNPLIKIFTGEIPYYTSNEAKEDDGYRLSIGGRALFEALFDNLMAKTNTAGVGFYTAPVENIKSHDFSESANANQISQSFLNYGMAKTGTQGIIPVTDRPTQGVAEISAKLEARFAQCIYGTLEKMLNNIIGSLNLQYDFRVHIFGDIYSEDMARSNALKQIDKGDITGWLTLCALDDISLLDKVALGEVVKNSGLLELLQPPQLSYTQSSKSTAKSDTGGSPTKTETEVTETKIEKQTESATE